MSARSFSDIGMFLYICRNSLPIITDNKSLCDVAKTIKRISVIKLHVMMEKEVTLVDTVLMGLFRTPLLRVFEKVLQIFDYRHMKQQNNVVD